MITLKKYFARRGVTVLSAGRFLTNKVTGRLYVLSSTDEMRLVDVVTGEMVKRVSHQGAINEELARKLLEYVGTPVHEDDFVCWYILSKQEAIGKFAAMIFA